MFDNDIIQHSINKRRRYANDLILLAALLMVSVSVLIILRIFVGKGAYISINIMDQNGKSGGTGVEYRHSLDDDGYFVFYEDEYGDITACFYSDEEYEEAGGENVCNILRISDGSADMIYATCPDQICVNTGPAFKTGQSVVCLPHRIIITVVSGENMNGDHDTYNDDGLDAVTW